MLLKVVVFWWVFILLWVGGGNVLGRFIVWRVIGVV